MAIASGWLPSYTYTKLEYFMSRPRPILNTLWAPLLAAILAAIFISNLTEGLNYHCTPLQPEGFFLGR